MYLVQNTLTRKEKEWRKIQLKILVYTAWNWSNVTGIGSGFLINLGRWTGGGGRERFDVDFLPEVTLFGWYSDIPTDKMDEDSG